MKQQSKVLKALQLVSRTIHAFQAERGGLCMYLSDSSEANLESYQVCVQNSDVLNKQILSQTSLGLLLKNEEYPISYLQFYQGHVFLGEEDITSWPVHQRAPLSQDPCLQHPRTHWRWHHPARLLHRR